MRKAAVNGTRPATAVFLLRERVQKKSCFPEQKKSDEIGL